MPIDGRTMTNGPTTLADLTVYFERSISEEALILTPATGAVPALVDFVASLPTRRLRLVRPDLQLVDDTLTVVAETDDEWLVGANGRRTVRLDGIRFTVTRPAGFVVDLRVTGQVTMGADTVAVEGALDSEGRVTFQLAAGPPRSVSLVALADYITDGRLGGHLPAGAPAFDRVPLSELRLSVGYRSDSVTELAASSSLQGARWAAIDGVLDLENIGVTFTSRESFQYGRYVEAVGGEINATVRIGRDFRVRVAVTGQNMWTLEVIPLDGDVLPGLGTLAELAGGAALATTVDQGIARLGLGELTITGVRIGFDLAARALGQIAIGGRVTLDGITFDVELLLPAVQLRGSLSPTTPIHLKALIGTYFPGAEGFPEVDITELDLSANPRTGEYSLYASIDSDWVLDVGPVPIGVQRFDFDIATGPDGMTGSIEGGFSIFGAAFDVVAEHPDAGGAWQFTCRAVFGQPLTIRAIHASVAEAFGVDANLPAAIEDLSLDDLSVWFDTSSRGFNLIGKAQFPVNDQTVDITVTIRLVRTGGGYTKTLGGQITAGELVFDLHFAQDQASTAFVATYRHTGAAGALNVRQLAAALSTDVAALVPGDLEIDLNDAMLAVSRTAVGTTALIGLDIGARLSLSGLPLVGQVLPADETASIDDLRLLVATGDLRRDDLAAINGLLPGAIATLPLPTQDTTAGDDTGGGAQDQVALARGFSVSARFNLGGTTRPLSIPVIDGVGTGTGSANLPATPAAPVAVASSDTTTWFTAQKKLGPLYLARVGVRYQNAVLWVLLDAALTALGLTVSLDGLALGSPVDRFDPRFDLRGLGIDYRNPAVEIGGAFLRATVTDGQGRGRDEYDGAAVLKAEALTLSAIGSYAHLDGHPSLFIYAVLDYPIGGPSFFFVTGLAAGFGYNRALIVPPVDQVARFPLVAEAVKGGGAAPPVGGGVPDSPAQRVAAELAKLRSAVPPSVGDHFLAVGVKFTSFQLIDSFALLTVAFGQRTEVNLLGLSTVVAPPSTPGDPAVPPLAEAQLALRASFLPNEGSLTVAARLTAASYLLSRECHISGGFAFSCWFPVAGATEPHAGDFVLTLGGYHPDFRVPAHYPRAPRLSINWKVNDRFAIKGESYFALTPSALMAGIVVDATWNSGDLSAWLHAGADFLVAWKPYHYDAHAFATLRGSYRFELFGTREISFDASADLHIWGPPFSGTARVKLSAIEFDITFGADTRTAAQPIGWPEFRRSFLPSAGTTDGAVPYCGISLRAGLVRRVDVGDGAASDDLGVVNPKRFVLITNSVIPSTEAVAGAPVDVGSLRLSPIGIGPMAVRAGDLRASHTVRIHLDSAPAEKRFLFTPIVKRVPVALWGGSPTPTLNEDHFVERALSGFEIRPRDEVEPATGTTVDRDGWRYVDAPVTPSYRWEPAAQTDGEPINAAQIRNTIAADPVVAARTRLLAALGVVTPVDVDASIADTLSMG